MKRRQALRASGVAAAGLLHLLPFADAYVGHATWARTLAICHAQGKRKWANRRLLFHAAVPSVRSAPVRNCSLAGVPAGPMAMMCKAGGGNRPQR